MNRANNPTFEFFLQCNVMLRGIMIVITSAMAHSYWKAQTENYTQS